jgi:citrate lyase beta subunit
MIRSMLFVPASRPDMIEKALKSAADAVCIDLEDSVAPADKPAARANVAETWRCSPGMRSPKLLRIFRINALDTHFAYRDLIEVVEAAGAHIDLVMLPKTNSPRDVQFVDTLLTQIETAHGFARPIGIEAQIETAAGFLYAREIAQSSPRLKALIFGPGDFAASMRMPMASIGEFDGNDDLYPGHRWHSVMQTIVAAARANGLRCLDGPYAGYKDATGFERSCRIARAMGFDGKQCIHPAQIAAANAIFSPSPEEIAHARRVVEACEEGAAASLDGKMIDAASTRMARVILQEEKP